MRKARLEEMVRGWFVGDFDPTLHRTQDVEIGVKSYHAGDFEERHHHKVATEITVIISGEVEMNGERHSAGDIIVIDRFETTDFRALTEATNVVVKLPGATNDKYMGEPEDA